MGLNIYLYRYDKPRKEIEKEDKAWEKVSSAIFHKHYDPVEKARGKDARLNDAEREAWKKEEDRAAGEFGRVGEWHENPNNPKIEIDSELYPKHMFKIGYFRSSYNGGGINSVLDQRVHEDLYTILDIDSNDYVCQPNWNDVIANCDRVIAALREYGKNNPFSVTEVSQNIFGDPNKLPKNEAEALVIAGKVLGKDRGNDPFGESGFSNGDGLWYPKGAKVFGVIPGFNTLLGKAMPCSYVVMRYDSDGEEPFKWYINAIEIVKETAQWVLKQPDAKKYYLHVSG